MIYAAANGMDWSLSMCDAAGYAHGLSGFGWEPRCDLQDAQLGAYARGFARGVLANEPPLIDAEDQLVYGDRDRTIALIAQGMLRERSERAAA